MGQGGEGRSNFHEGGQGSHQDHTIQRRAAGSEGVTGAEFWGRTFQGEGSAGVQALRRGRAGVFEGQQGGGSGWTDQYGESRGYSKHFSFCSE